MNTDSAKCAIQQLRQEMENLAWCLDELEELICNPNYAAFHGTNAEGISYMIEALICARKYFNKALVRLGGQTAELKYDSARNVPVEIGSDAQIYISRHKE